MSYDRLDRFLREEMRMSHVYQPVMLMALLKGGGKLAAREIAREILHYDESQVDYYTQITKNMPGRVLSRHGIVKKEDDGYALEGFEDLSSEQRNSLIKLCQDKLTEYIDRRKNAMWKHRVQSLGYISGSIRYEVLKRAQFHCELCGISHEIRALEVDHIVPRSKGGSDDLSNFQALCYQCNAMKRNTDNTDFRKLRATYKVSHKGCVFCRVEKGRKVAENELAFAIFDAFPVTELHSLIIPRRHIISYFEMSASELKATDNLLREMKQQVESKDAVVQGFNIGVNAGATAGQTIDHMHIHLIPRRAGDVANPRGGVRHLMPGKGFY